MKKATFAEGVGLTLVISLFVAILFTVLSSVFFSGSVLKILIMASFLFYINYLLIRSNERIGKLSVNLVWLLVSVFSLVFIPSLLLFIAIQLFMIWVVRSLYFYNSIFSAISDLLLTAMSMIAAIWAWTVSGSLFLSFWCFFLVQALFVFIPKKFMTSKNDKSIRNSTDDKFEHAYRAAETAVEKLVKYS